MRQRLFLASLLLLASTASAQLPAFNFMEEGQAAGWNQEHDIHDALATAEGLRLRITGEDLYLVGPPRDYPPGIALRVAVRMRSEQGGIAQIFYFTDHPTEAGSVRIPVRAGEWIDARANLPPLGPGYRLRIDPPGTGGTCLIQSVRFTSLRTFVQPKWPQPLIPIADSRTDLVIASGPLKLIHSGKLFGAFTLDIAGRPTAIGWNHSLIGYLHDDEPVWASMDPPADCHVKLDGDSLWESLSLCDRGGATWRFSRRYTPAQPGAIDVLTTLSISEDRNVLFLPMFGLHPGAGSFGQHKTQALFAGLEYLDRDEPSSSEADVIGPASRRQVPDALKITCPLMALVAEGRYVGLIWQQQPRIAAVFDSPDRLFASGGHVMGLVSPGSDGFNRAEGSLLPLEPTLFHANQPLELKATIIAGQASDVTPAVRQYVGLRGLPAVPRSMSFDAYVRLAAAGWLDSKVHDGAQYHHAIPGHFPAQPAADAAMMQDWLASQCADPALADRLRRAAGAAIAKVPPDAYLSAAVSHIRYPVESLVYGHVDQAANQADRQARALLARFEPDGSVRYRPTIAKDDLGKTHFAPDANGLTASLVAQVLQDATVSGNLQLIHDALRLLRGLDKFAGTVPRGAQTWEVPLHTPDILASAHLVRAYTLGFELTGDPHFLDQAKYWAWAGVPFIYLVPPSAPTDPVGPFAGIAVLGATQWNAPLWMGLPVQWCALVYADALYRLAPHDPTGPWKQLANGITASGIQQTWPIGSDPLRQGLLPDSFNLRAQSRNDAAINPATLQADAVRLYDRTPLYDFQSFRAAGLLVHAPGRIDHPHDSPQSISFEIKTWLPGPYHILIVGLKHPPRVQLSGHGIDLRAPHQYLQPEGRLILQLDGPASVRLMQ